MQFQRIEFRVSAIQQIVERHRAVSVGDDRAVARGDVVDIVQGRDAVCAGHVLNDDAWFAAGKVLADEARQHARIGVVTSARPR